jgi:hypothetical protein
MQGKMEVDVAFTCRLHMLLHLFIRDHFNPTTTIPSNSLDIFEASSPQHRPQAYPPTQLFQR